MTPVEKCIAFGLYKLCSSAEGGTIALLFAMGQSSVDTLYHGFCEATVEVMEANWIKTSALEDMADQM